MTIARATVITDASFCPRTRAGGWAAWININWPNGTHERIKKSGLFHESPDNSTAAERWACYNGIWFAYNRGARSILAQTDCLSVVRRPFLNNNPAALHWPEAQVSWRHVKGHTAGNTRREWVNNWCDSEAKKHMRKQRSQCLTT